MCQTEFQTYLTVPVSQGKKAGTKLINTPTHAHKLGQ